jgi:hypothetical protein
MEQPIRDRDRQLLANRIDNRQLADHAPQPINPLAPAFRHTWLMHPPFRLILALGLLTLAGCAHLPVAPSPHPFPPPNPTDLPCLQTSHACIALNPDVTPATIRETICVPGYTQSVRPSTTYTNGVKRKLLSEAGLPETGIGNYELDHIIPLALGGHPRKLSNLMLQPWEGAYTRCSSTCAAGRVAFEADWDWLTTEANTLMFIVHAFRTSRAP